MASSRQWKTRLRVPPLRADFDTQTNIAWPTVSLEDCRQLDDNADDDVVTGGTCSHTVTPPPLVRAIVLTTLCAARSPVVAISSRPRHRRH